MVRSSTFCIVFATCLISLGSPSTGWTMTRQPSLVPSRNYAVVLNGVDGFVRARDTASLRIDMHNAFSVTSWVRFDRFDNNVLPRIWEKGPHYLCVMGNPQNRRFGTIGLEVQNSSFGGNDNGGAAEFWGATKIRLGQWYFVAVTFDGHRATDQAQIYVNGVPERMSTIFPWVGWLYGTTGTDWFLGRRHTDQARNLDGGIGEVTVYQRVLTPTEISTVYEGGVVANAGATWSFSESNDEVARDGTGNGNHAAIVNGVVVERLS